MRVGRPNAVINLRAQLPSFSISFSGRRDGWMRDGHRKRSKSSVIASGEERAREWEKERERDIVSVGYQWSVCVRTWLRIMYCHQSYSSLMKANDSLRGPLFSQLIVQESILGPLCLCCVPNMICTCLLLCCLRSWAWAALSGGLCQNRNLCGTVDAVSVYKCILGSCFYFLTKHYFFCHKNKFSWIIIPVS